MTIRIEDVVIGVLQRWLVMSEVFKACGLNDDSVSNEEYARRYQACIDAQAGAN